jgi:serine/threonine-protein kinase RsbW
VLGRAPRPLSRATGHPTDHAAEPARTGLPGARSVEPAQPGAAPALGLVEAPGPDGQPGVRLPHTPGAVPLARRHLLRCLRGGGLDETLDAEVGVVVSELLGNAVRHGEPLPDGTVALRWRTDDGGVEVEVVDGGSARPAVVGPRRPHGLATGGRGLRIVHDLATAWGTSTDRAGRRTVWAALGRMPGRRSA